MAGGVVITSATAELPGERDGLVAPFGLGALLYTVVLLDAGWRGLADS